MGDLVRVYATSNAVAGELTRGRLEAEGIPVMLKGEGGGPYRAGPVYLWVPTEHEIAARQVIEAVERGEYAVDPNDPIREDGASEGPGP
jgi:hypothetical protein